VATQIGLDLKTANDWINEYAEAEGKTSKIWSTEHPEVELPPTAKYYDGGPPSAKMVAGMSIPANAGQQIAISRNYPDPVVPVYGVVVGGASDGYTSFNGEIVERVQCPSGLEDVAGLYATMVAGTSMTDRFEPGNYVFAHPNKPARRGDYVVIQIAGRDGDPPSGYVKRLVSRSDGKLTVEQLNPPEKLVFDGDHVVSVHKVVFSTASWA